MRGSWANHYRRMLPSLLSVLEFRTNNALWRPVLAALDWLKSTEDGGCRLLPLQACPIDEGMPARWRRSVIDEAGRLTLLRFALFVLVHPNKHLRPHNIRWSL